MHTLRTSPNLKSILFAIEKQLDLVTQESAVDIATRMRISTRDVVYNAYKPKFYRRSYGLMHSIAPVKNGKMSYVVRNTDSDDLSKVISSSGYSPMKSTNKRYKNLTNVAFAMYDIIANGKSSYLFYGSRQESSLMIYRKKRNFIQSTATSPVIKSGQLFDDKLKKSFVKINFLGHYRKEV